MGALGIDLVSILVLCSLSLSEGGKLFTFYSPGPSSLKWGTKSLPWEAAEGFQGDNVGESGSIDLEIELLFSECWCNNTRVLALNSINFILLFCFLGIDN